MRDCNLFAKAGESGRAQGDIVTQGALGAPPSLFCSGGDFHDGLTFTFGDPKAAPSAELSTMKNRIRKTPPEQNRLGWGTRRATATRVTTLPGCFPNVYPGYEKFKNSH